MGESVGTRGSLLLRIRDCGDAEAWSEFVDIYTPLIYGYGRCHGLQDADAADLTQDVLRAVAGSVRRFDYDSEKGSFRGWFLGIVRNKLHDFATRNGRIVKGTGDTAVQGLLDQQVGREDETEHWNRQCEQRLFAYAGEQIRHEVHDKTWQAFWRTAIEGKSGKQVAAELEMSVAAVYLAKSRVMARLKERVRQLTDE